MKIIERESELRDIFTNSEVIGVDTETTELDPYTSKLRLVQLSDGSNTQVIDVFKTGLEPVGKYLKPILENKERRKVLHNAKFDIKFIKQKFDVDIENIFDTFLGSTLIQAGEKLEKGESKGYHGLGQVAKRHANIDLNKDEQLSDWSGILSDDQIMYAVRDAESLPAIRLGQIELLKESKQTRAAKLEFDAVLPVAWQELSGFYLDMDEWSKLADTYKPLADEAQAKIFAELEPYIEQGSLFEDIKINLDSVQQVQKYFKLAGVPLPTSTKKFELTALANDYPLVQWLLDYRGNNKAQRDFGENFREFINPITGRIHPDVWQLANRPDILRADFVSRTFTFW